MADEILQQGVRGISELITVPGLVNVDFADVKAIMHDAGSALMGIGRGSGDNRAVEAAKAAISSPLLDLSIDGAKGILFTVTAGTDLGMLEINEAAKIITSSADSDAKVIFGAIIDESMNDEVRITVIATGFADRDKAVSKAPGEKTIVERTPFGVQSASLFNPPFPRTMSPKPIVRKEERRIMPDDDISTDTDDELEIPAFIRKKMM